MTTCPHCKASVDVTNQHTECPKCGKAYGTDTERSDAEMLTKVCRWFEDWETATRDSRKDAERDRDYYDGIQWSKEEVQTLNLRGQPPIVKNRIAKKVNFLTGTEVRNRADPKGLPRTPAHSDDAAATTDALRYVCDDVDFDHTSSRVWENILVEGYGGAVIEHEIVGDEPVEPVEGEPPAPDERSVEVRGRYVKWDRLWYDIHSREPDFSDAHHLGISTWWDLDDAIAFYSEREDVAPDFEENLKQALMHHGDTNDTHGDRPSTIWVQTQGGRERIRVSECYYRIGKDWWVCHHTKSGWVIKPKETGYLDDKGRRHQRSLEMASAFVTRDGMRYGLVRHMIGPQDEINKRSSKALHWLSVDRTIAEEGAVLDPEEARVQRAKPDGWVSVTRNALAESRIIFEKGIDMAQGQIQLLAEAKGEIDSIGPDAPQIASMPGSASGRARQMAMQVGAVELARVEDNHKRWKRACYRQMWCRVRQFWSEEKWVRVRDDAERTGFRFVGLNRRMTRGERFQELLQKQTPMESAMASVMGPDSRMVMEQAMQAHQQQMQMAMQQQGPQAQQIPPEQHQQMVMQLIMQHPLMAQPMVAGDVAQLQVDIILDESPDTSILQQEEYEQLVALIPSFLQAQMPAAPLLEMALEASQLRTKKRLLEMMRKPPDPQQTQMQQMMQQLQQAGAQATVAKTQSEAQLNQAKTQHEMVSAQLESTKVGAEAQRDTATAMKHAADAGSKAGGMPGNGATDPTGGVPPMGA